MNRHAKRCDHGPGEEPSDKCNQCGEWYSRKDALDRHIRRSERCRLGDVQSSTESDTQSPSALQPAARTPSSSKFSTASFSSSNNTPSSSNLSEVLRPTSSASDTSTSVATSGYPQGLHFSQQILSSPPPDYEQGFSAGHMFHRPCQSGNANQDQHQARVPFPQFHSSSAYESATYYTPSARPPSTESGSEGRHAQYYPSESPTQTDWQHGRQEYTRPILWEDHVPQTDSRSVPGQPCPILTPDFSSLSAQAPMEYDDPILASILAGIDFRPDTMAPQSNLVLSQQEIRMDIPSSTGATSTIPGYLSTIQLAEADFAFF